MAIEKMNNQIYHNKIIKVEYSFKENSNEWHGSKAEWFLAEQSNKL